MYLGDSMDGFENDERIEIPTKFIRYSENESKETERKLDVNGQVFIVHPNKDDKFNFPYVIYIPNEMPNDTTLLVQGVNTNRHKMLGSIKASLEQARNYVLGDIARNDYIYDLNEDINMPIMTPLFPIFYDEKDGQKISHYIQMFNSDALRIKGRGLNRVDNQLVEMIKDAQNRLKKSNINVDDKVIMEGFSSSSQFTNHFALLHPEILKLIICGAFNGTLTLPKREINGEKLIFPIGIGDVPEITDEKIEQFKNIKQFYYMKTGDLKDPYRLENKNGFIPCNPDIISSTEERQLCTFIGTYANHDRMENIRNIYTGMKVNSEFALFHSDIEDENSEHTPEPAYHAIKEYLKEYS
jgi:hypothetical protein